jgi:hypothetical protein
MLKQEYIYSSTLPLGRHGRLWGEFYLYPYLDIASVNRVGATVSVLGSQSCDCDAKSGTFYGLSLLE